GGRGGVDVAVLLVEDEDAWRLGRRVTPQDARTGQTQQDVPATPHARDGGCSGYGVTRTSKNHVNLLLCKVNRKRGCGGTIMRGVHGEPDGGPGGVRGRQGRPPGPVCVPTCRFRPRSSGARCPRRGAERWRCPGRRKPWRPCKRRADFSPGP